MSEAEVITRKWGNSLGVALPHQFVQREKLYENQRVIIEIKPVINVKKLRGVLRTKKSAQQLKDEMRSGWE